MEVLVFKRHDGIVSRAWCPAKIKCCVSVSRTAQLRRSLQLFVEVLLQKTIWSKQKNHVPIQHAWQEQSAPETPMPEIPLIRVLETFDLSATNVEHFLDSKADLKALIPMSVPGTQQEHV